MKFALFVTFLFLVYEPFFYLVRGKTINKEKSDCTLFYNFVKGDSKDYADNCCEDSGIECDEEGYIISFENSYDVKIPVKNLASFPYLSRIDYLDIRESDLKEIPNSILNLKSLTDLVLNGNNIEVIPPAIQNLSKLTHLGLLGNAIKELPNEMFNLKNLEVLDVSENKIEVISPAIKNLSNLMGLYLEDNDIKELPKEIFSLPNLERLALFGNMNLKTKVTNPNNSSIKYCLFSDIDILCYEPNSCKSIILMNEELDNLEAEKKYKECPKEVEEDINQNENGNINQNDSKSDSKQNQKESNSPTIFKSGIIIGCAVVIPIGGLVAFTLIKKNKSRQSNRSDSISNNEYQSRSVEDILKNNQDINNSIDDNVDIKKNNNIDNNNNDDDNNNDNNVNNSNSVNNNNSNDDDNVDSNNNNNSYNDSNKSNNSIHNIKSSINPNDVVNSYSYNTNTFPGRVVLIDNTPTPDSVIMNNGTFINNNNKNNNHGLLGIQNIPPSYDQINMNMNASNGTIIYYTTVNEIDEPLPEYTEN